jgi:hypothetical protein
MKIDVLKLIQYIVWYATDRGVKLTFLRLVKFLYLVDLTWARENKGEPLTGWPWKFVYYGPFCIESLDAIEKAYYSGFIKKDTYPSKFVDEDYNLYWCSEKPDISESMPSFLKSPLDDAISKWGDDTYGLLDYVYFDTEPMLDAKKGDLLDFSKARKFEKPIEIKMRKLNPESVAKGKEILERLKTKYKEELANRSKGSQPIYDYDEVYYKAAQFLDEEDLVGELSGKVLISTTGTNEQ